MQDVLLDACCGNGIVTVNLAKRVSMAVGVDFSTPLLNIARSHYQASNISYLQIDLTKATSDLLSTYPPVTKVCFHTAVQYFTYDEFRQLLIFFKSLSCGLPLKVR